MNVDSEYRKSLKPLIVAEARKRFRIDGIKATKMDDISRCLHISKRTLYELYVNKEELLLDVLKEVNSQRHERLVEVSSGNVMDILLEVLKMEVDATINTNQSFYYDIQKYPKALALLRTFYEDQRRNALQFYERGVEEGYFIPTIEYKTFINITSNIMDSLKVYTMNEQIPMFDVFKNYILVLMRGMCTQKGIASLDEFNQQTAAFSAGR